MKYHAISLPAKRMIKFIKKSATPKIEAAIIWHLLRAKGPIIFSFETSLMRGTRANGSCTD